jgi:hypothetical protein
MNMGCAMTEGSVNAMSAMNGAGLGLLADPGLSPQLNGRGLSH